MSTTPITIAYGDGIGHEIMDAALMVMREAGAKLEIVTVQIGKSVYKMGSQDGVLPSAWESLERTRVLLKGPTVPPPIGGRLGGGLIGEISHASPLPNPPPKGEGVTSSICARFGVEMGLRVIEECYMQPEISAVGYVSKNFALFEPLQDAAEKLVWKNRAHPGAMILASAMMLEHIGQKDIADTIRHALQTALSSQKKKLRTRAFAESVVGQLLATVPA